VKYLAVVKAQKTSIFERIPSSSSFIWYQHLGQTVISCASSFITSTFISDEAKQLAEETVEKLQPMFFDHSTQVSKQNEEKVWGFLETRLLII
jgi:hypothetical protein